MRLIRKDTSPDEAKKIEEQMRQKMVDAANFGMDGSWVIHPQQAQIANDAFTPRDEQLEEATYSLRFYHEQGGGAIFDPKYGRFHDEATIKMHLVELAKGVQAGKIDNAFLQDMANKSAEITGYNILEMMHRVH